MQNKPTLPSLLISAGYTPRVAKALAWLILRGDGVVTSREIERGADLRQPEVHYAISVLEGMKWIEKIETPSTSKPGRPFTQYRFQLTKEQVYTEIKSGIDKKAGDLSEMASRIHEAIFTEQGQPGTRKPGIGGYMNGTHTVVVPGGKVEVRNSPSLFAFIYWLAAVGCILAFMAAGLQHQYLTAVSALYITGIMMVAAYVMRTRVI